MNNISIKQFKTIFTPFTRLLLKLFCFIFVFSSIDGYMQLPLTMKLRSMFYFPILHPKFYSIFELLMLLIILIFIAKYQIKYSRGKKIYKILFFSFVICFLLDTINPNVDLNRISPIFGLPLLTNPEKYIYLLLVYFLLFTNDKTYITFTRYIIYNIAFFTIIRVIILFILWVGGGGNKSFGGIPSVLQESDVLIIIAFIASLFFFLYLCDKNKKYIRIFFILFIFLLLSFRRSAFLLLCISVFLEYSFNVLSVNNGIKKVARILLYVTIIIFITTVGLNILHNYNILYLDRMFGMFVNKNTIFASDSGHFLQSKQTLEYVRERVGFWGTGLGTDQFGVKVLGASVAGDYGNVVHNVYASLWLYRGFYMIIFLFFLFFIALSQLISLYRNKSKYEYRYMIIKSGVIIFFLSMMIMWYFHPLMSFDHIKMRFLWVSLIVFIIRFKPEHTYHYLVGRKTTEYNNL